MLFPENDAPELKTWIVKHLETPAASDSDVDADVLADYVLALLRHDGDADDVRQLCETELYDFLKDEAKPFVASVFEAVTSQSYKPGARPPTTAAPSQTPSSLPPLPPSGSKKRSYHESSLPAKPAAEAAAAAQGNGRAIKQPRRGGGRGGRETGRGGANIPAGQMVDYLPPPPFGAATGSRDSSPPPGTAAAHYFPSVPPSMETLMHMSQMGMPVGMYGFPPGMPGPWGPGAQSNGNNGHNRRSRRRCRYMEKNGFCTKKNCTFDHGDNPPAGEAAAFHAANGFEGGFHPMLQHAEAAAAAMFQQMMPPMLSHPGGGSQRGGRKPRRGGRAAFSADGPVFDKTNSTVVVEGIPDEFLHEEAVREFFAQFGSIVSITMQPKKKLAIVQFDTWASANAAYQSPKVIFDNRFVKVYWHRDEKGDGTEAVAAASEDGEVVEGGGGGGGGGGWRSNGADLPEIDMDDFLRRQEEAQQRHDEKLQKKQELDHKRQELEQRQRALQIRQQEERQRLIAKMAEVATRARQGSGSGTPSEDGSTPKTAAISQTEMIRAQLAALEEEARQLGLDPDAVAVVTGGGGDASSTTSSSLSFAGRGGRGRGRGGFFPYRGRGGGGRGGRGGVSSSVSAAYAAYSLDNRPRRVALTGVDFTVPEQGEALRAHLLIVGDFVDIETTPEKTTIAFVDRRTAEKFYLSAKVAGPSESGKMASRTIPGVDGLVELTWVPNTAGSSMSRATSNSQTGVGSTSTDAKQKDMDAMDAMDTMDAMESVNGDEGEDTDQQSRQQEPKHEQQVFPAKQRQQMDFDVADEGDWDLA